MYMKHLDDTLLRDMLALAGDALRDQLLADLTRCAEQLQAACTSPPENSYAAAKLQQQILHELRGIGLTIGASPLVSLCREGDAMPIGCARSARQDFCDRVVEACAEISALIAVQGADAR